MSHIQFSIPYRDEHGLVKHRNDHGSIVEHVISGIKISLVICHDELTPKKINLHHHASGLCILDGIEFIVINHIEPTLEDAARRAIDTFVSQNGIDYVLDKLKSAKPINKIPEGFI